MKFLDKAVELSYQLAEHSEEKYIHFAFMFHRNKLLSIGKNNSKRETAKVNYFGRKFKIPQFINYGYPHAEIDCISKRFGKNYISGKENLVVIRIGRSGKLLESLPCENCSVVLKSLGFRSVWHSTNKSVIKESYL